MEIFHKASCQFITPNYLFSRTWERSLWNVTIKTYRPLILQYLWEDWTLTLVGALCQVVKLPPVMMIWGFPCGSDGKESTCNAGNLGSVPGLWGSPGEGKGYSRHYSGGSIILHYPWGHKETQLCNFHSLTWRYEKVYFPFVLSQLVSMDSLQPTPHPTSKLCSSLFQQGWVRSSLLSPLLK